MDLLLKFSFISKLFFLLFLLPFFFLSRLSSSSSSLHPLAASSAKLHRNYTAISNFRLLNRRKLITCPDLNSFIQLEVISNSKNLLNEEFINVTISGIPTPSEDHWVAIITPSNAKYVRFTYIYIRDNCKYNNQAQKY